MTKWTKQDTATLKQLKTKGISNAQIAKTLNVSKSQIQIKVLTLKKLHNLSRGALSNAEFNKRWAVFTERKRLLLASNAI